LIETFKKNDFYFYNSFFSSGSKKKSEKDKSGKCSLYKGRCGGTLSNGCCKAPYKCGKSTAVCGKDKLCCLTETDIQRHKQESGNWLSARGGK